VKIHITTYQDGKQFLWNARSKLVELWHKYVIVWKFVPRKVLLLSIAKIWTRTHKMLSYRKGTARRSTSVEILSTAAELRSVVSSSGAFQDRSVATFHAWVGTVRWVERVTRWHGCCWGLWRYDTHKPTRLDLFVLHDSFQFKAHKIHMM